MRCAPIRRFCIGGWGSSMTEKTYVLEDQIGFKLRLANQRHLELFNARLAEVTPMQFSAMVRLGEHGVLSQNHLGRLVAMDAATTKGVVDRLRTKGFVDTRPSETDRRRFDVTLTAEGQAYVAAALPVARQISAATTRNLTAREAAQLAALLDKM